MVEALNAAELPKGVFNVVTGLASVVGAELVRNPDVAKISFTGSVAVGEAITPGKCRRHDEAYNAELGGSCPQSCWMMLRSTRPFQRLLPWPFSNSGQARAAGTWLLAPRSRLDEVKRAIRMRCVPSRSAIRPIPTSWLDPWCRKNSMSAWNLTFGKALKKARRCWSEEKATRRVSKQVTS